MLDSSAHPDTPRGLSPSPPCNGGEGRGEEARSTSCGVLYQVLFLFGQAVEVMDQRVDWLVGAVTAFGNVC